MPKGKKNVVSKTSVGNESRKATKTTGKNSTSDRSRSKLPGNVLPLPFGKQKQNMKLRQANCNQRKDKSIVNLKIGDLSSNRDKWLCIADSKDNRVQFDGYHNTRYQAKLNDKTVSDETREHNNVEVDMDAMPEAIDRHVGDEVLVTVHASEDDFQSEDSDVEDNGATLVTGGQTSYQEWLKAMRQDPIFKEIVGQAVAEQMRLEKEKEKEGSVRGELIEANREGLFMNSNNSRSNVITPIRSGQAGNVSNAFQKETCNKSPSDTMIYVPAFAAKTPEKQFATWRACPQ